MNRITDSKLEGKTLRRYLGRFFLFILVYTVAYTALVLVVYTVGTRQVWYASNPLYYPLALLAAEPLLTYFVGLLLGYFAILLFQFAGIAKEVATLVGMIEHIALYKEQRIDLPERLKDVEAMLRSVQMAAMQSDELAREAEQRKNDLVVYLAHDLKTPLTSVIGYLTLLRDEKGISPELREKYLDIATNKAIRLEDLINEFFEITRFNLKGLALEPVKLNFSRMVEQIGDEFRPIFAEKGLDANISMPADIELVADAGKLERVIDNLLRNAANYSWPNTTIDVEVGVTQGAVTLAVRNQGDTIPPHKLNHIFEQFYRVDQSRSTEGGSGLGLAIAKEIVEKHGGTITAASENEVIEFTVILPLVPLALNAPTGALAPPLPR